MTEVYNVKQTIAKAVDTFYLDRDGQPELVPTGLVPLDEELGGLGPGACGILAAATGVGKSSAMLAAMLNSPVKVGAVSMEDGADVVGTRLLAALSGIDSLLIRRKAITKSQLSKVNKVAKSNKLDHMFFSYQIGAGIGRIEDAIEDLCAQGCQLIWLDYLQKVRGHGKGDRRNEVAETFTRCHAKAAAAGASFMAVSQFRRVSSEDNKGGVRIPSIHHLKESGDLENEARIIVLAHKQPSPDGDRVRFRLAKSTYGGEYVRWDMLRAPCGTLKQATYYKPTEGDWG